MKLLYLFIVLLSLGSTSCSKHVLYQTRYVPTPSEIKYDMPCRELANNPPALGEQRKAISKENAKPRFSDSQLYGVRRGDPDLYTKTK